MYAARTASLALVLCACAYGCGGDDDRGPVDAGADGTTSRLDAGVMVETAASPAGPVLTPCAEGWREVMTEEGTTVCDPWPESGIEACSGDTAHFPGEAGCTPIGTSCPADGWPQGLPADSAVVFVRQGATAGDGSQMRPYGGVAMAARAAGPDVVVAIGAGTYQEYILVHPRQTLWGACPADTILTHSEPAMLPVLGVGEADVEVRNLSFRDGLRYAVAAAPEFASVHLEDVVIDRMGPLGLLAIQGSRITTHSVLIRGTRNWTTGEFGTGAQAEMGSTLELDRTVIVGSEGGGVGSLDPESTVVIRDSLLQDNRTPPGRGGWGVFSSDGGPVALSRSVIADSGLMGMLVQPGGHISLEDVVVSGTRAQDDDRLSGALFAFGGGTRIDARRVHLDRNAHNGLTAIEGAEMSITDSLLEDSALPYRSNDCAGAGLLVEAATVRAERLVVARMRCAAVGALGSSTMSLTDVALVDTRPDAASNLQGVGLVAGGGSDLTVVRGLVLGASGVGVALSDGSTAQLDDLTVKDIESEPNSGFYGRGLDVASGSMATGRRMVIEHTRDVGVYVLGAETVVQLEQVTVFDTRERGCAAMLGCEPSGIGVAAVGGALRLDGFVVERANICGVMVAEGASVDLVDGAVLSNPIGACIQVDGYDIDRLGSGVIYGDNEVNLDATTLPVPEPAAPFGASGE